MPIQQKLHTKLTQRLSPRSNRQQIVRSAHSHIYVDLTPGARRRGAGSAPGRFSVRAALFWGLVAVIGLFLYLLLLR